ncbi:hypothetical protein VTN96DRAFT_7300 [Rasamsonia emersonii]
MNIHNGTVSASTCSSGNADLTVQTSLCGALAAVSVLELLISGMDASQVRSTPYTDNGGTNGGRGTWDRILRCYGTSVVQGPTPVDRSALAARKQPSLAVHPINDAKKLTKDLGRRRKLELQRSRDLGWQAAGQNVASPSMIVARIIRAPWGLRIASKDGPTRIKSFTTISFATLHFGFQRTLWTPIFSPVISRRGKEQ